MTTTLSILVGARLRAIRKEQRMRLWQVAEAMRTTPQTVQRLETAQMTVTLSRLENWCAALGVTPQEAVRAGGDVAEAKGA